MKNRETRDLKKSVGASQQWRCAECRHFLPVKFNIHHTLAIVRGGTNERSNLKALCPCCHSVRTTEDVTAYRQEVEDAREIHRLHEQLLERFKRVDGATVPLWIVAHVMATFGWAPEVVEARVIACGYRVCSGTLLETLWKHSWRLLGCTHNAKSGGLVVHGLLPVFPSNARAERGPNARVVCIS